MNDAPVRIVICGHCGASTVWLLKETGRGYVPVNFEAVWDSDMRYNSERHTLHSQTCKERQRWILKLTGSN